jgi:signal transduction histidine kinase
MSRRASIFDRLALKERVAINQQMKSLGALSKEARQIDEMRQKLDEMARDQAPNDGVQNAGSLRAAAQLNFQIHVQLETANNRSEHLAVELRQLRQRIAQSDRRREKSANKADALRTKARNDRDAKREDDEASRRRNQPR